VVWSRRDGWRGSNIENGFWGVGAGVRPTRSLYLVCLSWPGRHTPLCDANQTKCLYGLSAVVWVPLIEAVHGRCGVGGRAAPPFVLCGQEGPVLVVEGAPPEARAAGRGWGQSRPLAGLPPLGVARAGGVDVHAVVVVMATHVCPRVHLGEAACAAVAELGRAALGVIRAAQSATPAPNRCRTRNWTAAHNSSTALPLPPFLPHRTSCITTTPSTD
jgi:hypothetical protein